LTTPLEDLTNAIDAYVDAKIDAEEHLTSSAVDASIAGALAPLEARIEVLEAGSPPASSLKYARPDTTGYTTLEIAANGSLTPSSLDSNTDYVVSAPYPITDTVTISGCRNVVWIGGEFDIDATGRGDSAALAIGSYGNHVTGDLYFEGIYFHGDNLNEAIEIASTDATLTFQNIRVDNMTYFTNQSNGHPDAIQPNRFEGGKIQVDHFTAYSGYQGMFMRTDVDYYDHGGDIYLSNINIVADDSTNGDGFGASGDTALYTSYAQAIEPWAGEGESTPGPAGSGSNDNTTVYTTGPWYVENCYMTNATSYVMEDYELVRAVNENNSLENPTVSGNEVSFPNLDRMRNLDDTGDAIFYTGAPPAGDFVTLNDCGIGYV